MHYLCMLVHVCFCFLFFYLEHAMFVVVIQVQRCGVLVFPVMGLGL
jgi:hypothetical protein